MIVRNGYLEPDPITRNKKRLKSLLGDGWTMKVIDLEYCVYRDLGAYDIEISGGCTKRDDVSIYVWKTTDGYKIVEHYIDLPQDDEHIKALCEDIVRRYSGAGKDS